MSYYLSSESCALATITADFVREVRLQVTQPPLAPSSDFARSRQCDRPLQHPHNA